MKICCHLFACSLLVAYSTENYHNSPPPRKAELYMYKPTPICVEIKLSIWTHLSKGYDVHTICNGEIYNG